MGTKTAPSGFGRPIWSTIKGGNQVHGVGLVPVTGTFALPNSTGGLWDGDGVNVIYSLFTAPPKSSEGGYWKLESVVVENKVAVVDNNHAANGCEAYIVVGRDPIEVKIAAGAMASKQVAKSIFMTNIAAGGSTVLAATSSAAPTSVEVYGPDSTTPAEVFLAPGDMLSLAIKRNGTGHDISSKGPITITAYLRHSPPGR